MSNIGAMDTGERIAELAEQLLGLTRPALVDQMAFIDGDRNADDFPMMIDDIVQFTGISGYALSPEARALVDEALQLLGEGDENFRRITSWLDKYHQPSAA